MNNHFFSRYSFSNKLGSKIFYNFTSFLSYSIIPMAICSIIIIMLIPTSNFLSTDTDKKTGEAINSIKIDFSKMVFAGKSLDKFTACKYCQSLLIDDVLFRPVRI